MQTTNPIDPAQAEKAARLLCAGQDLNTLLISWRITTSLVMSPALAMARGWIMDELERRDPQAFDLWIDSLESNPDKFFLKEPAP